MARRQRLCPEITDPELRAFLDMVPSIRRFNTELALSQPLSGEQLTVPLDGRELTVYLHRAKGNDRPAVFEFHGGGFVFGNAEKDDSLCETLCRELDLNVIGVNYRLAPENPYPAPVDDAYDVIRYFRLHGKEYGLDPEHMAVLGFSGGATLATAAALRAGKTGGVQAVRAGTALSIPGFRTYARGKAPLPLRHEPGGDDGFHQAVLQGRRAEAPGGLAGLCRGR